MEYSIKEMDEMCIRLNNLSQELLRRRSTPEVLNLIISEAVDLVQRIGGSLAWAYGSAKGARWGEQFVQPFVDRRVTERFRELLMTGNAQLQAQVLQTIHILLQSTRSESTLFCNLTAGWYLNQVVAADYDFRNNEDLLHLWMTVVKDIALMMDKENLMLFFDPAAERPFPIFAQSAQFYHHPVAQVRTQVQATSLEIFTKLKSADAWMEDLFGLVVADSKILFTHVVCLLRHFWRKTEEAARSNERKEKQEHMRLQNDVLMYLADVFTCEVPELNIVLQERLLRFAVLPVLLGSALQLQQLQHAMLSQETSWAVFCDFLQTLRSCHQLQVLLATVLFRHYVTDEVLQLVTSPALRTPVAYFELQKFWGGRSHGGVCDGYDAHRPDSVLYESIPIRFASEPRRTNRLCKAFLERTGELYEKGRVKAAINALRCMTMLLEAFGASNEALEKTVAEEMGTCLARCLARHGEVCWSLCLAALRALRQLMEVPGSHSALPSLRERLLQPLATELLHEAALQSQGGIREAWLQDFQEQWAACHSELGDSEPQGRSARSFHILFSVVRLLTPVKGKMIDMPGKDEAESDEAARYMPGSAIYLGKQNRVLCRAALVSKKHPADEERLYLLPSNNTLVLVRPDEHKAFYGEVVISEPLRLLKIIEGDENSHPLLEHEHLIRIQVLSPNSPRLKGDGLRTMPELAGYPTFQGNDFEASWCHVPSKEAKNGPVEVLLIFPDQNRRKVAERVINQAQGTVNSRLFDGIQKFLTSLKLGN